MVRGAVLAVGAEVAQTEELVGGGSLGVFQAGFHLAAGEHLQGVGVQAAEEVLAGGVGIGIVKQVIVLTDLGLAAVVGVHPVDGCALDLPAVGGVAPLGGGVVGGQHLHHVAVFVLDAAGAGDQVGTLQTALGAVGGQALVLGNGGLHEVVGFNPQIPGEGDLVGAGVLVHRIVLHLEGLALAFGVVGDGELHRLDHRHDPLGGLVQILPEAVLQESELNGVGGLGHAHPVTEVADGLGGVAPAAQTAEGGHPGIVPAGDPAFLHQLAELPLGQHRVVNAQSCKLNLPGMAGNTYMLHHPVVKGTVVLKFQGAQAVGDTLQSILNGVGKVVHGVDAPLVSLAVVVHMANPVDYRVPHIEVAGGQVNLGS